MAKYFLILGLIIQFSGALLYIRGMMRGSVKVNRVPWVFIAIAAFVGTSAAAYEGARWATLPKFMSGFGPFSI